MAAQQVDLEEVNEDFIYSARCGDKEEMLQFLAAGADVNARGSGGNGALHMACANGHVDCVRALLERGANPALENEARNTPAHYAAQQRQAACLEALASQPAVDMLAKNEFGRSVLTDAISTDHAETATVALEHSSATEEKIMHGLGDGATVRGEDGAPLQGGASLEATNNPGPPPSVTHTFNFFQATSDNVVVYARELAMTSSIEETLGDGGVLADRTGLGIWASSLVLARWLSDTAATPREDDNNNNVVLGDDGSEASFFFHGKRVLELGSGCGVGGLALAAAQPTATVVLSDAHPETLENLRHNAALAKNDAVTVLALDWERKNNLKDAAFDVLVGADLVYADETVDPLVRVVSTLVPPTAATTTDQRAFWYAAPATDRAGSAAFVARLRALGYVHTVLDAPDAYYANPVADDKADDSLALYFSDLTTARFKLHTFVTALAPSSSSSS